MVSQTQARISPAKTYRTPPAFPTPSTGLCRSGLASQLSKRWPDSAASKGGADSPLYLPSAKWHTSPLLGSHSNLPGCSDRYLYRSFVSSSPLGSPLLSKKSVITGFDQFGLKWVSSVSLQRGGVSFWECSSKRFTGNIQTRWNFKLYCINSCIKIHVTNK